MSNISSFKPSSPPEPAWPEYERPPMPDAEATARLLEEMSQGSLGPISKLQEALNLTIEQIADWMAHPRHRFVAANLVNLYDVQTQLMVCQHRLLAVAKLAEVITRSESPETVRRACKDLLSVRLIDPYREDERPSKPPPPPDVSEEAILEALEKLGAGDGYEPSDEKEASEARAALADGGVKASLPVVKVDSGAADQSMQGAPMRAQTQPYEPSSCARSGSCGDSGRGGSRADSSGRAPPRAMVRRY